MFRVKAPRDFGAGMVIMLIGIAGIYFGKDLTYGTAGRMGPGYFPFLLSMIIITLGAGISVKSLFVEGPPIELPMFQPLFFVVASIIIFGYLTNVLGLAITAVVTTLVAVLARSRLTVLESMPFAVLLILAGVMATYGWLNIWPAAALVAAFFGLMLILRNRFEFGESLIFGIILSVGTVIIFVYALGQPVPDCPDGARCTQWLLGL
jgi:Tripartite tricarboxylate transporter TctB family